MASSPMPAAWIAAIPFDALQRLASMPAHELTEVFIKEVAARSILCSQGVVPSRVAHAVNSTPFSASGSPLQWDSSSRLRTPSSKGVRAARSTPISASQLRSADAAQHPNNREYLDEAADVHFKVVNMRAVAKGYHARLHSRLCHAVRRTLYPRTRHTSRPVQPTMPMWPLVGRPWLLPRYPWLSRRLLQR